MAAVFCWVSPGLRVRYGPAPKKPTTPPHLWMLGRPDADPTLRMESANTTMREWIECRLVDENELPRIAMPSGTHPQGHTLRLRVLASTFPECNDIRNNGQPAGYGDTSTLFNFPG